MNTIQEAAREIPVVDQADVVVVGGGPAGMIAAIAAARNGASALLLERYGFLGGMATAGLVGPILAIYHWYGAGRIVGGIPWEMLTRMKALDGAILGDDGPHVSFDPEVLKYVADQMMLEAGASLRLHTFATAVSCEGERVNGVIVESKSGRQAVVGKVIVDATGDADVAAWAGNPYEKGHPETGAMQPMSLYFRLANVDTDLMESPTNPETFYTMVEAREVLQRAVDAGELPLFGGPWAPKSSTVRDREAGVNMVRVWGDATDVLDLTRVEITGRDHVQQFVRFLKANIPGFKDCYLYDSAPQIGIRETRRIAGDYTLTERDLVQRRQFDDGIALGGHIVDIHSLDGTSEQYGKKVQPYEIPYRSFLPVGLENVIVTGRPISATHEAHASLRVMGTCMALGEAAGTAAAIAAREGGRTRSVDSAELVGTLKKHGAIVDAGGIVKQ
jgi:hypothetical protein